MKRLSMAVRKQGGEHQKRWELQRPRRSFVGTIILLCGMLALLSACTSGFFATPSQSGTPVVTLPSSTAGATVGSSPTAGTATPTITLQVTGCPSNLSINWDSLVGTHANVDKVQKVICGSLEGAGSLAALVDVRYYSPDTRLDFYVYDNLPGTPNRRFSAQGLLNGDALISSVGTVITAEINPEDPIKGLVDIFKEYQWNGTAFGQIVFPGIYPDVTRYQSEQAQAGVNAEIAALQPGQTPAQIPDAWRLSPGGVVSRLTKDIFHWSNFNVTLPPHAASLTVLPMTVTNLAAGGGGFIAVVHHLNEVSTNIFEIEQVTSINGSAGLTSPAPFAQLTSPVSVTGSSAVNGNVQGQVVFYDDMYTMIASSGVIRSPVSSGFVQFTDSISYHLAPGLQEGVIAFYPTSQNNVALSNQAILVKVLWRA